MPDRFPAIVSLFASARVVAEPRGCLGEERESGAAQAMRWFSFLCREAKFVTIGFESSEVNRQLLRLDEINVLSNSP